MAKAKETDADRLLRQIDAIVDSGGSKADRARELFGLGCERTEVVELLDMSYSQAHSIWKQLESGGGGVEGWQPSYRGKAKRKEVEAEARVQANLHFSPTQVRYVTQDGHRIVRIDTERGPECRRCGAHLTFSLEWLAFVHSFSSEDPTEIIDKYPGEEVQVIREGGSKP